MFCIGLFAHAANVGASVFMHVYVKEIIWVGGEKYKQRHHRVRKLDTYRLISAEVIIYLLWKLYNNNRHETAIQSLHLSTLCYYMKKNFSNNQVIYQMKVFILL